MKTVVGERKRIEFLARFPTAEVLGHRFAVHVMLRNLIANAIAYTPEGGRVEVSTRREGEWAVLSVDDSGPGIRPQDRERALERFNRLGRTQSDGVGLGLAIVQRVVEAHAGEVLVESTAGQGSSFLLRFSLISR